jgi:membrane protein
VDPGGRRRNGLPPGLRTAWQRAGSRVEAVRDRRIVARVLRITDRYGQAGGGILAAGLAYSALFAVVPAFILLLGLSGAVLSGALARDQLANLVGTVFPPLRPVLLPAFEALARDAGSISIVGLVTLAWGAGGFARALEVALTIIMGEGRPRGFIAKTVIGFGSVLVIVLAVVTESLLAGAAAFIQAAILSGAPGFVSDAGAIAADLIGPVVASVAIALVYRYVPPGAPRWRSLAAPSATVGILLALSTRLFVALAPRLIGAAAALGTLATVFAALAWFGLTFQAILLGAAWIADNEGLDAGPSQAP